MYTLSITGNADSFLTVSLPSCSADEQAVVPWVLVQLEQGKYKDRVSELSEVDIWELLFDLKPSSYSPGGSDESDVLREDLEAARAHDAYWLHECVLGESHSMVTKIREWFSKNRGGVHSEHPAPCICVDVLYWVDSENAPEVLNVFYVRPRTHASK